MNTLSTPTPRANASGLTAALLIITPLLAALTAWSVPRVFSLAEHPGAWLVGIAAAAVAATAIFAAAESREDAARTVWPLLLAWPLAFPVYMNRRQRLGSGLAGALLLCGALAWSGWQVRQGEQAAAFLLQASGEQKPEQPASTGSGQASGEQIEAERQRIIQQRIDRMLDAEQAR